MVCNNTLGVSLMVAEPEWPAPARGSSPCWMRPVTSDFDRDSDRGASGLLLAPLHGGAAAARAPRGRAGPHPGRAGSQAVARSFWGIKPLSCDNSELQRLDSTYETVVSSIGD